MRVFILSPLSDNEGSRFFVEPVLSGVGFFAVLRMTGGIA